MVESLRVQAERTNRIQNNTTRTSGTQQPVNSTSFSETLTNLQDVHFSNHAQKRLESRDIQLSEENVNRLSNAIDRAEKRGGKNSLVLVDDLAFIVNVRDRMVVTALDAEQRGEGVFTQIDSVVFADPAKNTGSTTTEKKSSSL